MHPDTLPRTQPAIRTPGPIFLVADDLTGACDSAGAFVSSGRPVRIALDLDTFTSIPTFPNSVIAFSTETRNMPDPHQAAIRLARITSLIPITPATILFKKIDSAARGHLGTETLATLDASGLALALVAPAFPQNGRTVQAGILTIRDAATQNTAIVLRDLFPQLDDMCISTLPTGPTETLRQKIASAIASGIRILLCDSETETDLEELALAASQLVQPILWTGSAGLAHAFAAALLQPSTTEPIATAFDCGRTLIFIGTDHPVTSLQHSYLAAHPPPHDHAIHTIDWPLISPPHIRSIFASRPTSALVLTGGETAAYVLKSLRTSNIRLAGELAPGIPWGILEGGDADGCIIVTKSGGFGSEEALVEAIHFCAQGCNRRVHATA